MLRLLLWKEGRAIEDELLIRRICQGDEDAFRQFVDRYAGQVYKITYSVLREARGAEDAAQEAFLQIYKSLPDYRFQGLVTWISRIALHKAIDSKRKRDRQREQPVDCELTLRQICSGDEDILVGVVRRERRDRLWDEVQTLPEMHREVIVAYYIEQQNYEQIATQKGITLKTVESRLYRARQWIRKHWKEDDWL
ncbi:RNA polymerase subunit sigma [Bacillus sp. FJAT-27264]|uniref:RNA polymerase sigma factor n=1 Tax=Paenibacillus sp. (strain DSM 101736 / FJAT-27264) TaxID=1850362 RepID=UPI000808032D|nr:sigma-70 family RNA polymerase sigma factor [Bacillus sp. FJAT-27264]OBZ18732.1 RNA polymerase subunit sigma [Bacillus sp. FJAT-27264]